MLLLDGVPWGPSLRSIFITVRLLPSSGKVKRLKRLGWDASLELKSIISQESPEVSQASAKQIFTEKEGLTK
jgi:hypothetical protein